MRIHHFEVKGVRVTNLGNYFIILMIFKIFLFTPTIILEFLQILDFLIFHNFIHRNIIILKLSGLE
jgi:hypothetical protein